MTTVTDAAAGPEETSRFARALAYFREALSLVDGEREPEIYGVVLHDIAETYRAQADNASAVRFFDEAAVYKRRGEDQEDLATTLLALADCLTSNKQWESTRAILDEASELLNSPVDASQADARAWSLHHLGASYQKLGDQGYLDAYGQAATAYRASLALTDATNDPTLYAAKLRLLGDVLRLQGDYVNAEDYYHQVISHLRRAGSADRQIEEAFIYISIGECMHARSDLQDAMGSFDKAHELLADVGGTGTSIAVTAHKLGRAYEKLGDLGADGAYAKALAAYQRTLGYLDQENDPGSYATALRDMGDVHLAEERWAEAVRLYEQAAAFMRRADNPASLRRILVSLGRAQRQLDKTVPTAQPQQLTD